MTYKNGVAIENHENAYSQRSAGLDIETALCCHKFMLFIKCPSLRIDKF